MQIQVVAVGKIRDRFIADGIAEYEKRLRPYGKVAITEIDEARRPDNPSPAQEDQALAREGEKILAAVPDGAYVIALAVHGRPHSSMDLAALIRKQGINGTSRLVFIIGGDLGLSPAVLERCNLRLSLSPMTFTHPMARLILLEQVYRAFRINRGEPYHR